MGFLTITDSNKEINLLEKIDFKKLGQQMQNEGLQGLVRLSKAQMFEWKCYLAGVCQSENVSETTAAVGLWRMSNISKWNICFGYDNYNQSEAGGCLLIFIDVEYQKRQWMI